MKKIYFLSIINFFFLVSSSGHLSGEDTKESNVKSIIELMEKAADWQLNNPLRIDLRFNDPSTKKGKRAQILWDGCLMRILDAGFLENETDTCLESWRNYGAINNQNISFCQLPLAVQNTITNKSGVTGSQIKYIRLGDTGSRKWEMAPFLSSLVELSYISSKPVYSDALQVIGNANSWKLGDRIYNADDHCVGKMYLDMYKMTGDPVMKMDIEMRFDWIIKNPYNQTLSIADGKNRWSWCDALYMSPPTWVKLTNITGDQKYIDFMDREWWQTTEYLYDKDDSLFYRDDRFFEMIEKNGKKVFWSRGNGWVLAALAEIIEDMPDYYPSKSKYIELYVQMAERITGLQPSDGMFRSSLLDPESYESPEASSTAFFCYALAWGINYKLLDKSVYLPVVIKSWNALTDCVDDDGKLGYVQLPGAAPGEVDAAWSAPYGVGAFILAGSEIVKILRD